MGRGLSLQDAMTLENDEQMRFRHRRTRAAIHDTYGEKKATNKRRKLPNGRKWKNKERQYAELEGRMIRDEYNSTQKVQKVLRKHYAQRADEKKNRLLQ